MCCCGGIVWIICSCTSRHKVIVRLDRVAAFSSLLDGNLGWDSVKAGMRCWSYEVGIMRQHVEMRSGRTCARIRSAAILCFPFTLGQLCSGIVSWIGSVAMECGGVGCGSSTVTIGDVCIVIEEMQITSGLYAERVGWRWCIVVDDKDFLDLQCGEGKETKSVAR